MVNFNNERRIVSKVFHLSQRSNKRVHSKGNHVYCEMPVSSSDRCNRLSIVVYFKPERDYTFIVILYDTNKVGYEFQQVIHRWEFLVSSKCMRKYSIRRIIREHCWDQIEPSLSIQFN
jgi:hypothetical protein